jgi:hypothetical protein
MVGNIYIPLISGSHQMEGIKEEAQVGLVFFYFSPSQLQKMDMLWRLGAHLLGKSNLIPFLLSNKKYDDSLAFGEGSIVHC